MKYRCSSRTSGSVIPEENGDEFWPASDIPNIDVNQVCGSSGSLASLPTQHPSAVANAVDINSRRTNSLRRGGSPATTYNSSYDSSPGRDHCNTNGYMLMSPGIDINRRYAFHSPFLSRRPFIAIAETNCPFLQLLAARVSIARHQVWPTTVSIPMCRCKAASDQRPAKNTSIWTLSTDSTRTQTQTAASVRRRPVAASRRAHHRRICASPNTNWIKSSRISHPTTTIPISLPSVRFGRTRWAVGWSTTNASYASTC